VTFGGGGIAGKFQLLLMAQRFPKLFPPYFVLKYHRTQAASIRFMLAQHNSATSKINTPTQAQQNSLTILISMLMKKKS
jgi:hypothetical protein